MTATAKPFIKWVGGKRQLLPEIEQRLPKSIDVYYEPFLGGGALFFHIHDRIGRAHISDINAELINAYRAIQKDVQGLITELKKHVNTEEYFLEIRDADRQADYEWNWTPLEKAARFIYLNKTCFNGLYRVNSKGHFNVPFGHYSNPKIIDEENLLAVNRILNENHIEIEVKDYLKTKSEVVGHDRQHFVYLDPPYIPLSISSSFTAYSKDGFSMDDQIRLRDYCNFLNNHGIKFMQSNSSAPIVFELYKDYQIDLVEANRSVSATNSGRAKVKEVIIRNYK